MVSLKHRGFTLIELIVVVTLLAILGTLAFYASISSIRTARNSKRVSDIANIFKGIELYKEKISIYPVPSNYKQVYYNSLPLWKEGEVTKTDNFSDVFINTAKTLKDPSFDVYYQYSVTESGIEFQIASIIEQEINLAFVEGTYNGKIITSHTGSTFYMVASPSIITSNKQATDLTSIINNHQLVYNGYRNLPSNYNSDGSGGFLFDSSSLGVYTGSLDSFKMLPNKKLIGLNTQKAYSGSILSRTLDFNDFMNIDFTKESSLIYVSGLIRQCLGTDY